MEILLIFYFLAKGEYLEDGEERTELFKFYTTDLQWLSVLLEENCLFFIDDLFLGVGFDDC